MKIYKANFNANQPATKQINVSNDSKFGIGVTVEKNGAKLSLEPSNVTLVAGDTTLSAEPEKYHDMVIFSREVTDDADKEYTVNVANGYDTFMHTEQTLSGRAGTQDMVGQVTLTFKFSMPETMTGKKIEAADFKWFFEFNDPSKGTLDYTTPEAALNSLPVITPKMLGTTYRDVNELGDIRNGKFYIKRSNGDKIYYTFANTTQDYPRIWTTDLTTRTPAEYTVQTGDEFYIQQRFGKYAQCKGHVKYLAQKLGVAFTDGISNYRFKLIENVSDTTVADGICEKVEIPDIPTKTSELENDSGFITISDVRETIPHPVMRVEAYQYQYPELPNNLNAGDTFVCLDMTNGEQSTVLWHNTEFHPINGDVSIYPAKPFYIYTVTSETSLEIVTVDNEGHINETTWQPD